MTLVMFGFWCDVMVPCLMHAHYHKLPLRTYDLLYNGLIMRNRKTK